MTVIAAILWKLRALFRARRRPAPPPTPSPLPWIGATRAAEQLLRHLNHNQEHRK